MTNTIKEGTILWEPSPQFIGQTNLAQYMDWLKRTRQLSFDNYFSLWNWSVTEIEAFWESIWEYFEIRSSVPYKKVLSGRNMPGARWFEGARVNYAEHVFRHARPDTPAIISQSELRPLQEMSWQTLYERVATFAAALKAAGIREGDRIVAYMPNIPEAVIAFLACASIGATWSSSSPDFGGPTVIDRFKQIEPAILVAVDGYRYGGKDFDRMQAVGQIQQAIPTLRKTVILPYLNERPDLSLLDNAILWDDFVRDHGNAELTYAHVPFDHPLWVLFSSGTTGLPKAIVQSYGGILIEHLKFCVFHMDLKPGDRFFWYTTTGWMMWNVLLGGLLAGSTIVLFDGNPAYPEPDTLWRFAEETNITLFGTSANYLLNCRSRNIRPKDKYRLEHLRAIGSTASPLPPEGFEWVYQNVKSDLWLCSTSGGTDLCTAIVGGTPLLPVHAGEMQGPSLGVNAKAFDEEGNPVINEVGELVVTDPMPSMPIYFWNDENNERYLESYFNMYPGTWRHGDWIKITDRGSCQIYGRSDSTINRGGVRIGTSEIYSAVEDGEEVLDSLVVDIMSGTGHLKMLLFVVLRDGLGLDETLKDRIRQRLREHCSPRHVPDEIYAIDEVPRTLNGKKLEVPIKKILTGIPVERAVNKGVLENPDSIGFFVRLAEELTQRQS
mgnify:CR=1 FL=1